MPNTLASSDPAAGHQFEASNARLSVLLPLALPGPLDYLAAGDVVLNPGDFVRVPLGAAERTGVVWDTPQDAAPKVPLARLKPVLARLDAPPLNAAMRRFIDWVATYTLAPPGAVLRMAMSVPKALEAERLATGYCAAPGWEPPKGFRLTPQRAKVLTLLAEGPARLAVDIRAEVGAGPQVVKGLVEAGALEAVALAPRLPFGQPDPAGKGLHLTADQSAAARALVARAEGGFSVSVLDGVTGSGKTEVYFEAIAAALAAGRQALVLLPEIALSAQWLDRFRNRFGAEPAVWHSDLGQARRRVTWRAVAEGRASVVVGARSALFLPFPDLGLIVVDEEHDASYKQEDGVFYNARDMAVVRGHLAEFPVVLASATPSLETVVNVERGRYHHLHLPERIGAARLPTLTLIDLRRDPPARGHWLSPPLAAALGEALAASEQTLLFLNRRGYAPLTLCRGCGYRLKCPHCSAWLVEHRAQHRLTCHHCGHGVGRPAVCPECGAEDAWAACGPGVERIAEEVARDFPEARIRIMASDTIGGPDAMAALVAAVERHEVDVLVGTQVIAKGHHFPLLTLVGVIDADLGLAGGDLRATERTHQLLTQVAGRAGRAERAGRVLVQTYMPEHPVMAALAAGEREAFHAAEKAEREAAHMPPFGRLAAVIISGPNEAEVNSTARALGAERGRAAGLEVLGPAPAALSLLRGRHRRRFLVKGRRGAELQGPLSNWLAAVKPGRAVRVQVDIDPQSFL